MHGPKGPHLKPATPMHGPIGPKQAHSRPQRRHRFHEPRQPRPQRRSGFHERPKNTTGSTTARPRTSPHETRDTNARRLTLTFETHVTNARPQQPKAGPTTPAKAIPVSQPTPTTPRKGDAGFMRDPTSLPPRTEHGTKLSLFDWFSRPDIRIPVDVSRVFHAHRTDTDTCTATNLASPIGLGSTPSPRTTETSSRHGSCAPELSQAPSCSPTHPRRLTKPR